MGKKIEDLCYYLKVICVLQMISLASVNSLKDKVDVDMLDVTVVRISSGVEREDTGNHLILFTELEE